MKDRNALLATLFGLLAFVGSLFWGVANAFPSPDAGIQESTSMQFHSNLAMTILVLSSVVIIGGVLRLIQLKLTKSS